MAAKPFEHPLFPLAIFLKITPEDRTTIENWLRSGALVASKNDDRGKYFSMADLLKVELMHRLRSRLGIPPATAGKIADQMIADYLPRAGDDLLSIIDNAAAVDETDYFPTYSIGRSEDGEILASLGQGAWDDPVLTLPVGILGRLTAAKAQKYMEFVDSDMRELQKRAKALLAEAKN